MDCEWWGTGKQADAKILQGISLGSGSADLDDKGVEVGLRCCWCIGSSECSCHLSQWRRKEPSASTGVVLGRNCLPFTGEELYLQNCNCVLRMFWGCLESIGRFVQGHLNLGANVIQNPVFVSFLVAKCAFSIWLCLGCLTSSRLAITTLRSEWPVHHLKVRFSKAPLDVLKQKVLLKMHLHIYTLENMI